MWGPKILQNKGHWDPCMVYLHTHLVDVDGINVGKYTNLMGPMGNVYSLTGR